MYTSAAELTGALNGVRAIKALVIGDLIVDRYLWGSVHRISPEAPVPVVEVKKAEDRLGGAGNVARNLTSIGVAVTLCGIVGGDEEAQVARSLLKADGVSLDGILSDLSRPTSLKTRVIAQRQQIVRIDRESTTATNKSVSTEFAKLIDKFIDSHDVIILEDYGKGVVTPVVIDVLEQAKERGRIAIGVRPLVVDPHPANYGIYGSMSVGKPNRREAEAATGIKINSKESAIEAAKILLRLWKADLMLITLGEDGLVIAYADNSPPVMLETRAREVFDVSGAGDTVTAVFSAALAAKASPRCAGELANIAAGIVVSKIGTVAIKPEEIMIEIEALSKEQLGKIGVASPV